MSSEEIYLSLPDILAGRSMICAAVQSIRVLTTLYLPTQYYNNFSPARNLRSHQGLGLQTIRVHQIFDGSYIISIYFSVLYAEIGAVDIINETQWYIVCNLSGLKLHVNYSYTEM